MKYFGYDQYPDIDTSGYRRAVSWEQARENNTMAHK